MVNNKIYEAPDPQKHFNYFRDLLKRKEPFYYVRFSDGETEIIRNNYLYISNKKIIYKDKISSSSFPIQDSKEFIPQRDSQLRKDLLGSATYRVHNFFKGIPTAHNKNYEDQELMIRLNGGMTRFITFADLFLNSNYIRFRKEIICLLQDFKKIIIVCNHRANFLGIFEKALKVKVVDNFFQSYEKTKDELFNNLIDVPLGSLILSSASSMSNIIGHKIHLHRKDLTFLDIGTSLNDLLGLDYLSRSYLDVYFRKGWRVWRRKLSPYFKIKW
jgi:hypothetical protein